MTYELHPAAEAELSSAARYYAKEASRNIALAFLAEFERVAELVEENRQLGTPAKAGLRVYPFRRFSYSALSIASGTLVAMSMPLRTTGASLGIGLATYSGR